MTSAERQDKFLWPIQTIDAIRGQMAEMIRVLDVDLFSVDDGAAVIGWLDRIRRDLDLVNDSLKEIALRKD